MVIVLTSNVRAAAAAGNVLLTKKDTGLDRDYLVANVSQLATIDREFLRNHSGRLPPSKLQAILRGVDTMLGR